MKLSKFVRPSRTEIQSAFEKLSFNQVWTKANVTKEDLALWSDWARLEPRLAEVLVRYFSENFEKINPMTLSSSIQKLEWPQSLAMLLDFSESTLSGGSQMKFRAWKKLIQLEVSPCTSSELYFFESYSFGAMAFQDKLHMALAPYVKWGFLGWDDLGNKKSRGYRLLSKKQRMAILAKLIAERPSLTVAEYMQALSVPINRRQAQRDLNEFPQIASRGYTRSKKYFVR